MPLTLHVNYIMKDSKEILRNRSQQKWLQRYKQSILSLKGRPFLPSRNFQFLGRFARK